jgi:hypothetical protein
LIGWVGEQELLLLRLMTPVAKFYTGKMAVATISEVRYIKTGSNQLDNLFQSNQGFKNPMDPFLPDQEEEKKLTEIKVFLFLPNTFKFYLSGYLWFGNN